MSRFVALVSFAAVLLLAGCGSWNDRSARFSSYSEFKADRFGSGGFLPSTLVPPSASDIRVNYNMDTTEIEAEFHFAKADAERVISPFRSPDQILIRELERSGDIPTSNVQSPLFVRCAERVVEFLQVTDMASARYWTSRDPALRKTACKPVAAAPMIST